MSKSNFRLILFFLGITLVPVFAHAVIEKKSSIVGTFQPDAKSPRAGITVHLLDSFFLTEVDKAVTDSNGQFIMSNVLPGLYLLAIDAPALQGMMKRVQVISDSPTLIDIRPYLNEEERARNNAWDRFKWTIRMAERNPLRDDQDVTGTERTDPDFHQGFLTSLRSFQEANNIGGQFGYMNVGVGPLDSTMDHQMAQFALQGQLEGDGRWSVNGNVLEGTRSSYIASGAVEYEMFGHHIGATVAANDLLYAQYPGLVDRQRISRFAQGADPQDVADESSRWIASVDLQDRLTIFKSFEVNYGTRIDYYGYLQDAVGYSPRVNLTYHVDPLFSLFGGYYRNTSAPGNYYLQSGDVHPYVHDLAIVPYGPTLVPETTTGYETGFDFNNQDFRFGLSYHFEGVDNKIATVDVSDSPVNDQLKTLRPFVVFNARDLNSRGLQINVNKQLTSVLSAQVTYNMEQAIPVYIVEKRIFSQRQIYFRNGETMEDFHNVQAGISANIDHTKTRVNANWKWSSGSPLVFGRKTENGALTALDVEVAQGLPVHMFSDTQLKLLLAVRNLLDQNPDINSNADFERALLYGMPRVVAGGVIVEF